MVIAFKKVASAANRADTMTKPLPASSFTDHTNAMLDANMIPPPDATPGEGAVFSQFALFSVSKVSSMPG